MYTSALSWLLLKLSKCLGCCTALLVSHNLRLCYQAAESLCEASGLKRVDRIWLSVLADIG